MIKDTERGGLPFVNWASLLDQDLEDLATRIYQILAQATFTIPNPIRATSVKIWEMIFIFAY